MFNNTDKHKWLHGLVAGICWSMDDLVVVVIHLGWKFELIVQVFAITNFSLFSKAMEDNFKKSKHVYYGMSLIVTH